MCYATVFVNCRRRWKKKVVAILPPPTRINKTTDSKQETTANKPATTIATPVENKAVTIAAEPKPIINTPENNAPKKINKAAGISKLKTKGVKINTVLSPGEEQKRKKEEFDETAINGPVTEFTEAALFASWDAFAKKMKAEERDSFYSTLSSRKPSVIGENQLLLKLDNQVQLMELHEWKADLLGFIREQLNNFAIQMKLVIEEQEQSTQLYTDTEKVKAMIEKNPLLADLMKKFNLDVGF